jgi:hypothetical protein
MTNPAGIDLATGEGVFVSTHGGGCRMLEVVGGLACREVLNCDSRLEFNCAKPLGGRKRARDAGPPYFSASGLGCPTAANQHPHFLDRLRATCGCNNVR